LPVPNRLTPAGMPLVQCNIFGETVRLVAAEVTWYLKYQVVLPDGRQTYNQVYTVRTESDFFHHTFCTVHTVHTVCSPHTLVVNPLLTTIVHHFFSSVLAEPQYIY
jgi:hypothetical protein